MKIIWKFNNLTGAFEGGYVAFLTGAVIIYNQEESIVFFRLINSIFCYNLFIMKIIDKDAVEKILTLSRLYLKEEEKDEIIPQLEEILTYFKSIEELNTENIEPMFHPPIQKLFLREDKEEKFFDREILEKISPLFEDGFVKVPKIVGD